MKSYRYKRDLDGVAVGDTRTLSVDEARPLLLSEAIEEVTAEPAPVAERDPAPVVETKVDTPVVSVTVEKPARAKKVQH